MTDRTLLETVIETLAGLAVAAYSVAWTWLIGMALIALMAGACRLLGW